ncbi:hypothetical protein FlaCF_3980 [Flavobacterium tructae]
MLRLLPFQGENDIIAIYFIVLRTMLFAFGLSALINL